MPDQEIRSLTEDEPSSPGGFVALAVIAAGLGAGAALLLAPAEGASTRRRVQRGLGALGGEAAGTITQLRQEIRRRRNQSRREKRIIGLAGLLTGAGLAAIFTPQSGPTTRQRLGSTLGRIKVGTVDRIERLRRRQEEGGGATDETQPVRSVQELGREPDNVF
jgi:hypothetical protein